jgi:hypothetical protein
MSSLEVRVLLLFLMGKELKKDEARSRVRCTVSEALYPVSTTFCEAAKKMRFDETKSNGQNSKEPFDIPYLL